MKKVAVALSGVCGLLVIVHCGKNSGGGSFTATTKLTSTALGSRSSSGLSQAVHPCPTGTHTCLTPANFSGKVIKSTLRVGANGDYTNIVTTDGGDLNSDVSAATPLKSFDFSAGLTFSSSGTISKDFGSNASFKDALIFFDYVDITFTAPSLGVSVATTLRLAYGADTALGYKRGDVLVKDGTDFKWCPMGTSALSQCSTTRPATPIVNTAVRDYSESGSPIIPYFTSELYMDTTGHAPVTTSFSQLNNGSWTFVIDFDATNSIAVPNGSYTKIFDVMPAIIIRGMSPTVNSVGQGMAGVLTATSG